MSYEFFFADTQSANRIFNRNSFKSMAAPFFFLCGDVSRSLDALVLRNGKEIGRESKGVLYLELFICLYFGTVKTYLVSLTVWLMSFFQPCLLLFCSFCLSVLKRNEKVC